MEEGEEKSDGKRKTDERGVGVDVGMMGMMMQVVKDGKKVMEEGLRKGKQGV